MEKRERERERDVEQDVVFRLARWGRKAPTVPGP